MTAEQLERTAAIAANVAYVLVVCSLLVLMFPGLRRPIGHFTRRLTFDWRYGLWLAERRRTPTPAWVVELAKTGQTVREGPPAGQPELAE